MSLNPKVIGAIVVVVGAAAWFGLKDRPSSDPAIATQQAHPTETTKQKVKQLLDYCATNAQAAVKFAASDMVLKVHSDAGYANESAARSRSGGFFYLGNQPGKPEINNGALLMPTQIIKHVVSSAAEAEIGAAFINCREAIPVIVTLEELGYPQHETPVYMDNTTAVGFVNDTIKQLVFCT